VPDEPLEVVLFEKSLAVERTGWQSAGPRNLKVNYSQFSGAPLVVMVVVRVIDNESVPGAHEATAERST
jgi:hypothetical protein